MYLLFRRKDSVPKAKFKDYKWFWIINGIAIFTIGAFVVYMEAMYQYTFFDSPSPPSTILFVVKYLSVFVIVLFAVNFIINFKHVIKMNNLYIILISVLVPILSYLLYKLISGFLT